MTSPPLGLGKRIERQISLGSDRHVIAELLKWLQKKGPVTARLNGHAFPITSDTQIHWPGALITRFEFCSTNDENVHGYVERGHPPHLGVIVLDDPAKFGPLPELTKDRSALYVSIVLAMVCLGAALWLGHSFGWFKAPQVILVILGLISLLGIFDTGRRWLKRLARWVLGFGIGGLVFVSYRLSVLDPGAATIGAALGAAGAIVLAAQNGLTQWARQTALLNPWLAAFLGIGSAGLAALGWQSEVDVELACGSSKDIVFKPAFYVRHISQSCAVPFRIFALAGVAGLEPKEIMQTARCVLEENRKTLSADGDERLAEPIIRSYEKGSVKKYLMICAGGNRPAWVPFEFKEKKLEVMHREASAVDLRIFRKLADHDALRFPERHLWLDGGLELPTEDRPFLGLTSKQAHDFCREVYNARLPEHGEWAKAAQGPEGSKRTYNQDQSIDLVRSGHGKYQLEKMELGVRELTATKTRDECWLLGGRPPWSNKEQSWTPTTPSYLCDENDAKDMGFRCVRARSKNL